MLKEIIIAFQSYVRAHQFIVKHKLWKWILIPGILYTILFLLGMYFFMHSANSAVLWISNEIGIQRFLHNSHNAILNFLFVMTAMMVHLVLFFFYFSLFKYIILIIGSPVFAYLSEQTEALINGKEYKFEFNAQFRQDMMRGVRLALRNSLWQTVYIITILILAFIPVVGWITPVICIFVECYYYGFSMLDHSCARHNLSSSAAVSYVGQHKGFAIGNGIVFYVLHFVPVVAPAYAVIAATISLYHQNLE